MKSYVEDQNVIVRDIDCVSHLSAKFKSFKLSVSVSDYNNLLDDDVWPAGIMVRRYNVPRNVNKDGAKWD